MRLLIQKIKVELAGALGILLFWQWMPRSIQMRTRTLKCFLHGEMIKETLCWLCWHVWKSDILVINLTYCNRWSRIHHFIKKRKVGVVHVVMKETTLLTCSHRLLTVSKGHRRSAPCSDALNQVHVWSSQVNIIMRVGESNKHVLESYSPPISKY